MTNYDTTYVDSSERYFSFDKSIITTDVSFNVYLQRMYLLFLTIFISLEKYPTYKIINSMRLKIFSHEFSVGFEIKIFKKTLSVK
jgi:hypothetical protein